MSEQTTAGVKAQPVKLIYGVGYEKCSVEEATHVTLNIPGPTGYLTLPVIRSGPRAGTGKWSWNSSIDKPTLRPSVETESWRGWKCHSWITNGNAVFLDDCTHEFRNQTVPLLDSDGERNYDQEDED